MSRSIHEVIEGMGIDKLRRTPHGYKGCCILNPNHIDRSPSMHINLEKGMVKCFACGFFQPLFDFLTDRDVPFDEAIDYLFISYEREGRDSNELTEYVLGTLIPKSMLDRGFSIQTLQHFEVGYDDYENRITIPLRYNGKLYGIQYRRHPKELWTTEGFNKDAYIYNWEPTEERTYVEGFTDTWRVWQNGTKEVSACMQALPADGQLLLMSKHKKIRLALDNDKAGWKGAFRIHHHLGREQEIEVVAYRAKDPGECDIQEWQRAIAHPVSFAEFEIAMIRRNESLYNQIVAEVRGEKGYNS